MLGRGGQLTHLKLHVYTVRTNYSGYEVSLCELLMAQELVSVSVGVTVTVVENYIGLSS